MKSMIATAFAALALTGCAVHDIHERNPEQSGIQSPNDITTPLGYSSNYYYYDRPAPYYERSSPYYSPYYERRY